MKDSIWLQGLRFSVILFLAGVLAAAVAGPVLKSFSYYQRTYNEGWNVYRSAQVQAGKTIYPAEPGTVATNYPPVSFHLTALAAPLFPNLLFAGRVLSGIALAAICALMAGIVYQLYRNVYASVCTGLIFGIALASYAPEYILLDDPQMLAQAILLAGVSLFLAANSVRGVVAAAVVITVALFTKHNLLAFPAAIAIWLVMERRWRWLAAYCGAGLFAAVVLGIASAALDGPGFLKHLLVTRVLDPKNGLLILLEFIINLYVILIAGVAGMVWGFLERRARLIAVSFAAAVIVGSVFASGAGVGHNMYFEALIAACLGIGIGLSKLATQARIPKWLWIGMPAVLTLNLGLAAVRVLPKNIREGREVRSQEVVWHKEAADFVAQVPGPVLCENLLVCYDAAKPMVYDIFNTGQLFLTGRIDPNVVLDPIRKKSWGAIILVRYAPVCAKADEGYSFPEPMLRALLTHYQLARTYGNVAVFLPSR